MECKYCDEFTEVCTNPECPMRADACPVPDTEGVCKYEDRAERVYKLSPKGCAYAALQNAGLIRDMNDPAAETFWFNFSELMIKCGYAPDEEEQICPM